MKDIFSEVRTALENIANNYGIIAKDLTIEWIDASVIDCESYVIKKIESRNSKIIPVIK